MAKCTGGRIEEIKIDADTGGVTRMRGGNAYCTLPAGNHEVISLILMFQGYLASSFFGGIMIFAGFNVWGTRIVSIIIGICLLLVLYWAGNWIARVVCVCCLILIAVLWWFQDSYYLPYFVLFMG
jgi:hypothetical protein